MRNLLDNRIIKLINMFCLRVTSVLKGINHVREPALRRYACK
uniref:Uncharacterized protein n=1 Tax=Anguilla anguilla TaxID=7936 RepID=A0A0E9RFF5_ANGAN